jgi:hypothetical protein
MKPMDINKQIARLHLGVFQWEDSEGTTGGWTNDDGDVCDTPPDYCDDLNAIHAAVLALGELQRCIFQQRLGEIAAAHSICFCECSALMWCEAYILSNASDDRQLPAASRPETKSDKNSG